MHTHQTARAKPYFVDIFSEEFISVTTQSIQQEDIEHEEEIEQQQIQDHDGTTVCVTEELTDTIEEEVEEGVYALELTDDSDCEDKEYLGN